MTRCRNTQDLDTHTQFQTGFIIPVCPDSEIITDTLMAINFKADN